MKISPTSSPVDLIGSRIVVVTASVAVRKHKPARTASKNLVVLGILVKISLMHRGDRAVSSNDFISYVIR